MRRKSARAGSPYLSRSYSANYGALLTADVPAAVDIERYREIPAEERVRLMRFACNPGDKHLLGHGVELLQIWSMKEAYAKYVLCGLELGFQHIHIYPVSRYLFVGVHRDHRLIGIRSWIRGELTIAVAAEMVKEGFSNINISEVAIENETDDDRGAEGLFAGP